MNTNDYRQPITIWNAPTITSGGKRTFATPIVSRCRWENRAERFIDNAGQETVSRAVVWVLQDVALDAYVAQGNYATVTDPTTLANAFPVRSIFAIPDLRMSFIERRLFL